MEFYWDFRVLQGDQRVFAGEFHLLWVLFLLVRDFFGISFEFIAKFVKRYEFFKVLLQDFAEFHGFITAVSLFAGICATTMVNPFWVINARMTISKVICVKTL